MNDFLSANEVAAVLRTVKDGDQRAVLLLQFGRLFQYRNPGFEPAKFYRQAGIGIKPDGKAFVAR